MSAAESCSRYFERGEACPCEVASRKAREEREAAPALICAWCGEPGTHADCIDAEAQAEAEKEADRESAAIKAARARTSLGMTGADWLDRADGVA